MPAFLPHSVEKAILRLYEDLATPTSLKSFLLFKNGEWDQLASQRLDPRHYLDAESYWRDATAISIVRKLDCLPTTVDRKAAAEELFLVCEKQCFSSNLRLLPYLSPGLPDTVEGVHVFFERARKMVSEILGPCPDLFEGRFGPGATYGDKGCLTTVPDKMSSAPTLTGECLPFLLQWGATLWAKACSTHKRVPVFIPGNRFTTVPKDCEKDRGIAIEPSINVFYQLAVGRVIRQRLKRVGINLTDGQEIHKRVACEASIQGHLCSMDLSNASDTISRNLVKLLLPPRWHALLSMLRSPKTLFQGKWRLLEKFSSMGNGFTFELETLVFLCLLNALDPSLVRGKDLFVYGDDLLFPSRMSNDVVSLFEFCGLTVNRRKTFVDGPFRESCGGDFFDGVDVRPFFLKESPNEPQQLIALANGLKRLTRGAVGRPYCVSRSWFSILDALPGNIRRLRGPERLGDLCVHDGEERWQFRWRSGIRYIKVYRPCRYTKVSWQNFKPDVILASAVYGMPWSGGGIIPRSAVAGYKIGWVASS